MTTSLPKRKHLDCDPMCDECIAAQRDLEEACKPAIQTALVAFWDVIVKELPECSHGGLAGTGIDDLIDAATQCVSSWAFNNLPVQGVENVWAGKGPNKTGSRVIPFARK